MKIFESFKDSILYESETHVKIYKGYKPRRVYNRLTKREAFELELEIYKRISGEKNFPKLINYDKKKMTLEIEHCGKPLTQLDKIEINDLDKQIKNIINVLKKNNIIHLDLHSSGKNICYKDGKIYLIDFDIAIIDNKPLNRFLDSKNKDIDVEEAIKKMFKGKKVISKK